jgi:hypothetical protein
MDANASLENPDRRHSNCNVTSTLILLEGANEAGVIQAPPCLSSNSLHSATYLHSFGPNVYYAGTREHLELQAASFVPVSPRTIAPGIVWGAFAKKLVLLAVGATFAGQAIAFFHQLAVGEKRFED